MIPRPGRGTVRGQFTAELGASSDSSAGQMRHIGFSGAAQTGYTSSTQVTFCFGEHGYLCGSNPPAAFGYPVVIP